MRRSTAASITLMAATAAFSLDGGLVLAAVPGPRVVIDSGVEAQTNPNQNSNVRVGEVVNIDQGAKQISIRTDTGEVVAAVLSPETVFRRVTPGASLDKATPITLADITVGDRVYLQGRISAENQFATHRILLMAKADIDIVREREAEQWRRGVAGQVSALSPETGRISLKVFAPEGAKTITVAVTGATVIRRYSPDSVKFSDAKPSKFDALKIGDQLRARGEKSADGLVFTANEIVSGSFQTIGGIVTAVDQATNEVKITVLGSKKNATVVIRSDTIVRKLTPQLAALIAQRAKPAAPAGAPQNAATSKAGEEPPAGSAKNVPTNGGTQPSVAAKPGPGGAPNAAPSKPRSQQPAGGSTPSAAGPKGGAPAAGPSSPPKPRLDERKDSQELIEQLPALPVSEIKPGDVIVVSSTTGTDVSRLNAIMFVTGVDAVLNAYYRGQRPPDLNTGLPAGLLLGIGQP